MKKLLTFLFLVTVASCTNYTRPTEDAETVKILFLNHMTEKLNVQELKLHCIYKGEVIGSEGHWYNYIFMSNIDMTQGAINHLKNNARKKGANVVMAHQVTDLITSVTYTGESYFCTPRNN